MPCRSEKGCYSNFCFQFGQENVVGQTRMTVLVCAYRILVRKRRAVWPHVPGQGMRLRLQVGIWGSAALVELLQGGRWAVVSTGMPSLWRAHEWDFNPVSSHCWMGNIRKCFGMECDCSVCSALALWWLVYSLSVTSCQRRQELGSPQGLFFIVWRQGIVEISSMPRSQAAERGLCLPSGWQCCRASDSFWEMSSPFRSETQCCWLMISVVTILMVKFLKSGKFDNTWKLQ